MGDLHGALRAFIAAALASWVLLPLAVTTLYAFSTLDDYYDRSKVLPVNYTLEQIRKLWVLGAGEAIVNSVLVGVGTVALSFLLGLPAGYSFARYVFRGKDIILLGIIATRMFPVIVIAVSLLKTFFRLGLNDTLVGVILAHTAMALPFVILISSSIFAGIPKELEEAGLVFGLNRAQVFFRIVMPMAAPGLAAAAMFTFLLSWNEVFIASVLTLENRTLPAFILTSALATPHDPLRFAAGFLMIVPALLFILLARRYLITMWGMAAR